MDAVQWGAVVVSQGAQENMMNAFTHNESFQEASTQRSEFNTIKLAANARRILDDVESEWSKPVVEMPLSQAFPQLGEIREFRSRKCIFNHDMTRLFNVVSDKYAVIQHADVIDRVKAGVADVFGADAVSAMQLKVSSAGSGARMRAWVDLPQLKPLEVAVGDIVNFRISVVNSYDYVWPYSLGLEGLRLVCKNGMVVGTKLFSISGKHFAAVAEKGMAPAITQLLSYAPKINESITQMLDVRVSLARATTLLSPLFPKKLLKTVLAEATFPKSLWELYNELTAFSTHNTLTLNRRTDTDMVIGNLFFDRRQAWLLPETEQEAAAAVEQKALLAA